VIANHIHDVEALGDIGAVNMDKVSIFMVPKANRGSDLSNHLPKSLSRQRYSPLIPPTRSL
jgi:hypothetical protein